MQKKISTLPFRGTAEQEQQLREIIDANKQDPSRADGRSCSRRRMSTAICPWRCSR